MEHLNYGKLLSIPTNHGIKYIAQRMSHFHRYGKTLVDKCDGSSRVCAWLYSV